MTPSEGPLLSVRGLSVHTAGRGAATTLVRDVSLDLDPGQTLGIVGESGSGKTLTARAIMTVLPHGVRAEGDIVFDGISLRGKKERELRPLRATRISMVLQDPFTALNPLQTIREHLRESLPKAVRRDRARTRQEIDRRLTEVGLDPGHVADRYPFQLSGGMRQRVAIAAALASDPDLLIADEPTTALDVTTQAEVLALLRKLQRERGMALILITHDLRVAFSVCDRVMVMYAGSVIEDAPGAELAMAPEHPYTLGLLLAEPPTGHYVEELVAIPGSVPSADHVASQCAFADRCSWKVDDCVEKRPELVQVAVGRSSACLRVDTIRDELRQRQLELAVAGSPPDAPESKPLLSVSNLHKTYRTTAMVGRSRQMTAVSDASFHIGAGESLGLVGETGSGKTTIARCVLGLTRPDPGSGLVLDGIDISDYRKLSKAQHRQVRKLVQVVFQDPYSSLNPSLTIGATLREAIAAVGSGDGRAEGVDELLDRVGLPASYAARRPGALSGGERQRVAIARAIAVRPRLLICDEPVAALDVSVQAQILELLRDVRRSYGTSMLFITHDLSVVRQMTDRAIVLRRGEVVESGITASLLDSPQHPYTVGLVEAVPGESAQLTP
ncbi:dipeptide ABC transporter ATP-binding protein [Amycolatopsis sp. NPDC098790]|uniref:dipeptide ABC transporter ATP-binding protein n=1 Tax=Amycolatopsis sp. NPDC098790 TaxID=3363939 RepID=UPI0038108816